MIFLDRLDKADAFVIYFTENCLSSNLNPVIMEFRKEEEQTEIYSFSSP